MPLLRFTFGAMASRNELQLFAADEAVARGAADAAAAWLAASAPVGEHLADQLLLPLALGAGGVFVATTASGHLRSNAAIVERFTGRRIAITPLPSGVEVRVV